MKEIEPGHGHRQEPGGREACTERGDRLDRTALAGAAGGALVLRREGRDASRQIHTVGSAGCQPLVRPNYGYFNAALPRSAPQVVIITPIARCFNTADKYNIDANSSSPAGCRANRALIETMDKAAIRAWLR